MAEGHSKALDLILYSNEVLDKLGIEGRIFGAKEVPYWKNGKLYCEIDVLIYTGDTYLKPYFVIEYKNSKKRLSTGCNQLDRYEEFVQNILNSDCYKLFVFSRDFKYEIIGEKPKKRH